MTTRSANERFPMLITITCTVLLLTAGVLVWFDAGESTITGLALVVAAIALSAISPAAGLAAVIMALPTMQHLNPMPRGQFTLVELAILTSTAGIGINLLLVSIRSGWKQLLDVLSPAQFVVPVCMLLAATAVTFLAMDDGSHRTEALREIRTVIIEPIMFLVTARLILRRSVYRSWVGTVVILTGAALAAYGVAQIIFDLGGVQSGDITRATGLYTHPNNMAIMLERSLLFTVGVAIMRPRWVPVWVLAAVQMAGLMATFSRGALIGVIVGIAVVLVFIGAWRWLLGLTAAGVIVGVIGILLFPDRLLDAGGDGTEPTRFAIWRGAVEMIKAHPVFGIGPDQFLYEYNRRFIEPMGWPERYTSHPHNIVLDTWLRLGIMGLATLVTLAAGVVWWIQKKSYEIKQDAWAIGAIAALFGGFVHSMVDNGFFLPDLAVLSWFFIVVLITVPDVGNQQESAPVLDNQGAPAPESTWPTWQGQS